MTKDKGCFQYHGTADDDQWRVGVASEVIDALNGLAVIDEFNFDMSNTILNNLCIN